MSILRADSIRDRAGTGAPDFPNGLTGALTGNVTGNVTGTATSATTATTATNAQGLTGTPNITVGTVTGTDATFSGNLTVQGTTTTIDTAVTSVDTLAVDGDVLIGGQSQYTYDDTGASNVILDVYGGSTSGKRGILSLSGRTNGDDGDIGTIWFINNDNSGAGVGTQMKLSAAMQAKTVTSDGNAADDAGANLRFYTKPEGGNLAERLHLTSDGTAIFKNGLAEKYRQGTTLAAASNDVALSLGNVHRFTTNESGAKTVNFTGVHSTLANGESVSFTVILTPNNVGYINAATVDGVAPFAGLKWSGGSAPSAGGSSGRDVYTFTIFKDGSATNSYEIFGAVQNYA